MAYLDKFGHLTIPPPVPPNTKNDTNDWANDRCDTAALMGKVWYSYHASVSLSALVEDRANGLQLFLNLDQVFEASLNALHVDYTFSPTELPTTKMMFERIAFKIGLALDALSEMEAIDKQGSRELLIDLIKRADVVSCAIAEKIYDEWELSQELSAATN